MSQLLAVLHVEVDLGGALFLRQALEREARVLGIHPGQKDLRSVAEVDRVIARLHAAGKRRAAEVTGGAP